MKTYHKLRLFLDNNFFGIVLLQTMAALFIGFVVMLWISAMVRLTASLKPDQFLEQLDTLLLC